MANYTLTPPARQMFDPSSLENTLASALNGPNANQLVGYLAGAQYDRNRAAHDYMLSLGNTNTQQGELARAGMASDERVADTKLAGELAQHPQGAALTSPAARIVAPDMQDTARNYTLGGLAQQTARTRRDNADAADNFDAAGVRPTMGADYSLSGVPQTRMAQGVSRAERTTGMAQEGANARATAGVAKPTQVATADRAYQTALRMHSTALDAEQRRKEAALARFEQDNRFLMTPAERAQRAAEITRNFDQRITGIQQRAPQRTAYGPQAGGAAQAASGSPASAAAPTPVSVGSGVSTGAGNAPAVPASPTTTVPVDAATATTRGRAMEASVGGKYSGYSPSANELVFTMPDGSKVRRPM